MPAGTVQDEHDLLVGTRADLTGKRISFRLEERDTDRGGEVEDGAPRDGSRAGCTKPTRERHS